MEPDAPVEDAWLGATDLAARLGVTRRRIYQLADVYPDFPRPFLVSRGKVWRWTEVLAWAKAHDRHVYRISEVLHAAGIYD